MSTALNWFHKCMEAREERNRLRSVIEKAPHDPSCWLVDPKSTWTKNERDCTCWKAEVL